MLRVFSDELTDCIRQTLWPIFHSDFRMVKAIQFLCVAYVLTATFTEWGFLGTVRGLRDPTTGLIIDPDNPANTASGSVAFERLGGSFTRPIAAETTSQMVLFGLSRSTAS